MYQQKARTVFADRGVAHRRGFKVDAPVLHRRGGEELLGDLIARARNLIMLPLCHHVEDAIERHHSLHAGRRRGMWIVTIFGGELIVRKPDQRYEMPARGTT